MTKVHLILIFILINQFVSCGGNRHDLWTDKYKNYQNYDYIHSDYVIIDACKDGTIKLGDRKEKICLIFGVPDQEHIIKGGGKTIYSDIVYNQFWFEFDENDKLQEGYLAQEEGAKYSNSTGFSMTKECAQQGDAPEPASPAR